MRKGFTLIELMIVVAIIAIIAAIAIPSLLSAMKSGRETSGLASVKAIGTAQSQYKRRNATYGTLLQLAPAGGAGELVPAYDGTAPKDDFNLTVIAGQSGDIATSFCAFAIPASTTAGDQAYATDESGQMFYNKSGSTAAQDAGLVAAAAWLIKGIE